MYKGFTIESRPGLIYHIKADGAGSKNRKAIQFKQVETLSLR